jgi:hypothetical protein
MTEEKPTPPDEQIENDPIRPAPTTRDDQGDDSPPPMIAPARGPMDQTTPDVPTGSTPLTRHDD